jgi:hypothetical protein
MFEFRLPTAKAQKHTVAQWLRHYATNRIVASLIPNEVNFYSYLILLAALGPGVYSASNRNEYQRHKKRIMFLGSKVRRVRRAGNLTTI